MACFYQKAVAISLLLAFFWSTEMSCAVDSDKDVMVGGIREIPVDDPNAIRTAKIVVDKLSAGDNKERKVIEIVKAGVQVVSGTLTHLTLKISDGEEERLYEASIWEQPWLDKIEVVKLEPVDS